MRQSETRSNIILVSRMEVIFGRVLSIQLGMDLSR